MVDGWLVEASDLRDIVDKARIAQEGDDKRKGLKGWKGWLETNLDAGASNAHAHSRIPVEWRPTNRA